MENAGLKLKRKRGDESSNVEGKKKSGKRKRGDDELFNVEKILGEECDECLVKWEGRGGSKRTSVTCTCTSKVLTPSPTSLPTPTPRKAPSALPTKPSPAPTTVPTRPTTAPTTQSP